MVVGVCRVRLMISGAGSLKEKRSVVRSVKDKVHARHHIMVAEVGDNDLLQTAQLGFAVVANDRVFVESVVDKILDLIEAEAKVASDDREIIDYGDGEFFGQDGGGHWEPDEVSPPIARPVAKVSGRAGLKIGARLKRRPR